MDNKKLIALLIASGVSMSTSVSASATPGQVPSSSGKESIFLEALISPSDTSFNPLDAANGCCGGATCNASCK